LRKKNLIKKKESEKKIIVCFERRSEFYTKISLDNIEKEKKGSE